MFFWSLELVCIPRGWSAWFYLYHKGTLCTKHAAVTAWYLAVRWGGKAACGRKAGMRRWVSVTFARDSLHSSTMLCSRNQKVHLVLAQVLSSLALINKYHSKICREVKWYKWKQQLNFGLGNKQEWVQGLNLLTLPHNCSPCPQVLRLCWSATVFPKPASQLRYHPRVASMHWALCRDAPLSCLIQV